MQNGESVFIPLKDDEFEKVAVSLRISNAITLVGRSQNQLYVLKSSFSNDKSNVFRFHVIGKSKINSKINLTFSFSFSGEKYLFQADCEPLDKETIKVNLIGQMYRAHRRQNFRLRIPESFQSEFILKQKNRESIISKENKTWKVADLSASGLRIENKSKDFQISENDLLKGELRFQYRPPLEIDVIVRHARIQKVSDLNHFSLGLQIEPLTAELENKLRSVVMDIYRDQFSLQARKLSS